MNAFLTTIFIQNTIAEYEIFQMGNKFKAILLSSNETKHLPVQITFWKEGGRWKFHSFLAEMEVHFWYPAKYSMKYDVWNASDRP